MNKNEFLDRAKNLAELIKNPEGRAEELRKIAERRVIHLEGIAKYDPAAAELEKAFFEANDAAFSAEMAVARHYANKLEK
jgi:hypothetical protein